jgi:hypothetical protein
MAAFHLIIYGRFSVITEAFRGLGSNGTTNQLKRVSRKMGMV